MKDKIRIGTRGSQLALYQAALVKSRIETGFPILRVEIVKIKTSGDMIRRGGITPFESKREFTKEIEDALLSGEVDIAVHSAKDLAVKLPHGLKLGAVLEREDPRDCMVSRDHLKFAELPIGSRIGTSALRRQCQLKRWNPDIIVEDIRGNVGTRLKKLEEGNYDALVLAHAGMKRLGLGHVVTEVFSEENFYPAPGQGAIVVESRQADKATDEIIHTLNHPESAIRLAAERAYLAKLQGGCQLPCGISTKVEGHVIHARAALFALENHEHADAELQGPTGHPEDVGEALADLLLSQGGREILEQIRESTEKKKNV